jgi:hypothetical protein
MAYTNAQIAKKLADAVNDSRGHTQGRNPVQHATYTSGASFSVQLRTGEVKTITVS